MNSFWAWRSEKIEMPSKMNGETPWPKISIVTPSYNQGKYIEETIRSVLYQGYPNLEYIIIDGGSTDETIDIIKKYQHELTYFVSEKDNGQTHAINKGFERATGEILAYINSDDVYMPYAFKLVAQIFSEFKNIHWVTGHKTHLVNYDVIAPVTNPNHKFNSGLFRKGYHTAWLMGWNSQPCTFWSRELLNKAGLRFNETNICSMDIDMWIRMSKFEEIYFIAAALTAMRKHKDQKSRTLKLDFNEIEGRARDYGFEPFWKRKFVTKLSQVTIARKIARWVLSNPKYNFIEWNIYSEKLELNRKSII